MFEVIATFTGMMQSELVAQFCSAADEDGIKYETANPSELETAVMLPATLQDECLLYIELALGAGAAVVCVNVL